MPHTVWVLAVARKAGEVEVTNDRSALLERVRLVPGGIVQEHALLEVGVPRGLKLPDRQPAWELENRRMPLTDARGLRQPWDTPRAGNLSELGGTISCKRAGTNLLLLLVIESGQAEDVRNTFAAKRRWAARP